MLVRENDDGYLAKFIGKLGNGYTKYYNTRNKRSGSIFQGKYKKKPINDDEYLLYISAYINGNAEIHGVSRARDWRWSSYQSYINHNSSSDHKRIKIDRDYKKYLAEVIINSKQIKDDKKSMHLE